MELGVVLADLLRLFECRDRVHVDAHFVHRDPVVEVCLPR